MGGLVATARVARDADAARDFRAGGSAGWRSGFPRLADAPWVGRAAASLCAIMQIRKKRRLIECPSRRMAV